MKKRNIITIILLIYLEYAGIIAGTLVAIFALRYVQGKKEKMRNYYKEESEKKTHNTDSKK